MNTINIICRVDENDDFTIEIPYIDYNINNNKVFTYTFWRNKFNILPRFFTNEGLDLLYISLFVFGVDRIILRESFADSWTRQFKLLIPVLELDKWNENKSLLERMLNYLSGDSWTIEFRSREYTAKEKLYKEKLSVPDNYKQTPSKICMFSGGLDSFIGSIDILEENIEDVLFVSHYGGGKGVREYQNILRDQLVKYYEVSEKNFLSFYASAKEGREETTRTRSFMFFSHAIVLATSMGKEVELIIPENGLISLNIPLTNSRLGSSSTRTTHPYYLELLQQLLVNLGIQIKISNPFQFLTKGEMIIQCKNLEFLKNNIVNTMSCSHPDYGRMLKEKETCHCGYCLPCTIRRAAIKKSGLEDLTRYRDSGFESGDTARINLNSYISGLRKFSERKAFLTIQKSGPIKAYLDEFSALYIRGMRELKELLEEYDEEI